MPHNPRRPQPAVVPRKGGLPVVSPMPWLPPQLRVAAVAVRVADQIFRNWPDLDGIPLFGDGWHFSGVCHAAFGGYPGPKYGSNTRWMGPNPCLPLQAAGQDYGYNEIHHWATQNFQGHWRLQAYSYNWILMSNGIRGAHLWSAFHETIIRTNDARWPRVNLDDFYANPWEFLDVDPPPLPSKAGPASPNKPAPWWEGRNPDYRSPWSDWVNPPPVRVVVPTLPIPGDQKYVGGNNPKPDPVPGINPAPQPLPVPVELPVLLPHIRWNPVTPNGRTVIQPTNQSSTQVFPRAQHRAKPARKYTKETKAKVSPLIGFLWSAVGELGEVFDFVGVLYEALPKRQKVDLYNKLGRQPNPAEQAAYLYQNINDIDVAKAINGLIKQNLSDRLYALGGDKMAAANRKDLRPIGYEAGGGLTGGGVRPDLATGGRPPDWWPDFLPWSP